MWQKAFEKHGSDSFTVVGLALDVEGTAPAKLYYDKFGVTFPTLVDPDYATRFGAVPKTFFVNEHGVVLESKSWEDRLPDLGQVQPVTDSIRAQWTPPGARLDSTSIARLTETAARNPRDLAIATQLASRYLALELRNEARAALLRTTRRFDAKEVARAGGDNAQLLGQAYLQMARTYEDDRESQVRHATLSFYLAPSVGFGKQIARLIAPEKFDGRPGGDFDNDFREFTLRRLRQEREAWLAE